MEKWERLISALAATPDNVEITSTSSELFATIQSGSDTERIDLNELIEAHDNKTLIESITKYCDDCDESGLPLPTEKKLQEVLHLVYANINSHILQGPRQLNQATRELQSITNTLLENPELLIEKENSITIETDGTKQTLNLLDTLTSNADYTSLRISDTQFDTYLQQHRTTLTEQGTQELDATLTNLKDRREVFMNLEKLTASLMQDQYPNKEAYRSASTALIAQLHTLKKTTGGPAFGKQYIQDITDTFSARLDSKQNGADFSYTKISPNNYGSIAKNFILHHYTTQAYKWMNAFQRTPKDTQTYFNAYDKYRNDFKKQKWKKLSPQEVKRKALLENVLLSAAMREKLSAYNLREFGGKLSRKEQKKIQRAKKSDIAEGKLATYQSAALTSASGPSADSAAFEEMEYSTDFAAAGSIDLTQVSNFSDEDELAFIAGQNFRWNPTNKHYDPFSSPQLDGETSGGAKAEAKTEIQIEEEKSKNISQQKQLFQAIRSLDPEKIETLINQGVSTLVDKDPDETETPITALIKKLKALTDDGKINGPGISQNIARCMEILVKTESPLTQNSNGKNAFSVLIPKNTNAKERGETNKSEVCKLVLFGIMAKKSLPYEGRPYKRKKNTQLHHAIERSYYTHSEHARPKTKKIMLAAKKIGQIFLKSMDMRDAQDKKSELITVETSKFITAQAKADSSIFTRTSNLNYNRRLNKLKKTLAIICNPTLKRSQTKQTIESTVLEVKLTKANEEVEKRTWMSSLYDNNDKLNSEIQKKTSESKQTKSTEDIPKENTATKASLSSALQQLAENFETSLTVNFKAQTSKQSISVARRRILRLSKKIEQSPRLLNEAPLAKPICKFFSKIILWHFKALAHNKIDTIPSALKDAAKLIGQKTGYAFLADISSFSDSDIIAFIGSLEENETMQEKHTKPIDKEKLAPLISLAAFAGAPAKTHPQKSSTLTRSTANRLPLQSNPPARPRTKVCRDKPQLHSNVTALMKQTSNKSLAKTLENAISSLDVNPNADLTSTQGYDGFFCTSSPTGTEMNKNTVNLTKKSTPSTHDWVVTTSSNTEQKAADSEVSLTFNRKSNLTSLSMRSSPLKAKKLMNFLNKEGKAVINIQDSTISKTYVSALKREAKQYGIEVNDLTGQSLQQEDPANEENNSPQLPSS